MFAVPFLQLIFTPALEVAATGALMSLIGVRFGMAALAARHQKARPGPDGPAPAQPMTPPAGQAGAAPAPPPTPAIS